MTAFDPNLRSAMDEIISILKRRNIAAHVLLASPTHTEFGMFYDIPKWSAVSFEGNAIRIKAKAASNPADMEKLEATLHMLASFLDLQASGYAVSEKILDELRKHVEFDHKSLVGREPDSVPEEGGMK